MPTRPAVVAGTWYPRTPEALTRDVDAYLGAAEIHLRGRVDAIVAPHAGLMFSGPVGAFAYKAAAATARDLVVLVGPSHFVGYDGVSIWPRGAFQTPLGDARIAEDIADQLLADDLIQEIPRAHQREHSLEMQLPFVRRLFPDAAIVPLLMGFQTRDTIDRLAAALARVCRERPALLVASTDLSHYFDAATAESLDRHVREAVTRFAPETLLARFEQYPEAERGRFVACGGGPAIAVMLAARALGSTDGRVLKYAHSGEVSGDYDGVVGYLAAAFGSFDDAH